MHQSVLTDQQAQFLRDEKEALAGFQLALAEFDLPREALDSLQKAILQLDELFLIVVAGEFNAGKSALINALLGQKVLAEGATPTTSRVTLVKWGEQAAEQVVDENFAVYTYPLPLLKELNIVDTPGTNAIIRHHERLTDEFVPAQRPGSVHHLCRSSPDRKRAPIPGTHPDLGQESRLCFE